VILTSAGPLLGEHPALAGWATNPNQAWKSAQVSQRPLLLFITTDNCVYCRKMEQDTFSNRRVAADIQNEFVAANVDAKTNPDLVRKLKVQSYPTTVIISPKAGVVDYIPGYVAPRELLTRLDVAARRNAAATDTIRR
jgi:protein disulfide-isomerase